MRSPALQALHEGGELAARCPAAPGWRTRRSTSRSPSRFSTGVPVSASRQRARSARIARACLVPAFLMAWASSATTTSQAAAAAGPGVAGCRSWSARRRRRPAVRRPARPARGQASRRGGPPARAGWGRSAPARPASWPAARPAPPPGWGRRGRGAVAVARCRSGRCGGGASTNSAMTWMVLPRPMSSARQPPRPSERSHHSQRTPALLVGAQLGLQARRPDRPRPAPRGCAGPSSTLASQGPGTTRSWRRGLGAVVLVAGRRAQQRRRLRRRRRRPPAGAGPRGRAAPRRGPARPPSSAPAGCDSPSRSTSTQRPRSSTRSALPASSCCDLLGRSGARLAVQRDRRRRSPAALRRPRSPGGLPPTVTCTVGPRRAAAAPVLGHPHHQARLLQRLHVAQQRQRLAGRPGQRLIERARCRPAPCTQAQRPGRALDRRQQRQQRLRLRAPAYWRSAWPSGACWTLPRRPGPWCRSPGRRRGGRDRAGSRPGGSAPARPRSTPGWRAQHRLHRGAWAADPVEQRLARWPPTSPARDRRSRIRRPVMGGRFSSSAAERCPLPAPVRRPASAAPARPAGRPGRAASRDSPGSSASTGGSGGVHLRRAQVQQPRPFTFGESDGRRSAAASDRGAGGAAWDRGAGGRRARPGATATRTRRRTGRPRPDGSHSAFPQLARRRRRGRVRRPSASCTSAE